MRSLLHTLLATACTLLLAPAHAQADLEPRLNVDDDGLWVEGYDPVAYTVQHRAAKGNARFTFQYQGATFRFVDQANRDRFAAAPETYLPAYGGWCAYALGAKNEKVTVDPETFKVKNGRVFLFYNAFFTNTRDDWNKDEARLLPAADRNWAAFKHRR
jgi:YHS domain-containing protein